MAAAGKKSKRIKGKTLGIGDFLGGAPIVLNIQTKTWPEEEDEFDMGQSSRPRAPVVLPSASRASRGGTYDDENVPKHPPYMAFISNLPYEVEDSTIEDLFANLKVANLRLPRELDGRLRGFGYVDFEDRESLVAAINIADLNVCGRRIRIDVSNSEDRRTGRRSDRDRDREYDPERTLGDWRSGTRSEKEGGGGGGGGGGEREGGRGGGDWGSSYSRREDRDVDTGPGGWRDARPKDDLPPNRSYGGRDSFGDKGPSRDGDRGFSREGGGGGGGGFSRDGDRGFSRDGDRGFSDRGFGRDGDRGFGRDSERSYGRDGDRGYGRDGDRDRGFGGFGRDGERDRDRGFGRDGDRDGGFRREGFGRSFGGGSGGGYGDRDRERDRDGDRDAEVSGEPRTRPKLQLLPRTVPLNPTPPADDDKSKSAKQDNGNESSDSSDRRPESAGERGDRSEQVASPSLSDDKKPAEEKRPYKPPVPAASIFGAARPVDTTAREREIEERLMKKAEEMRLRDGHSRDRDEKRMWSRDKKVDDFDDKRGPPRRPDDRRRDDRGRDENRDERSRDDRNRDDYPRDERGNRLPYRGTGNSREYRGSRNSDSKEPDSKESKDYRNSQDAREGRESRDGGRSSRSSNNDRAISGSREVTEKDNKEVRKERNFEDRPMPKAKDHEPPNFIAQNKYSYLENADDDDASE